MSTEILSDDSINFNQASNIMVYIDEQQQEDFIDEKKEDFIDQIEDDFTNYMDNYINPINGDTNSDKSSDDDQLILKVFNRDKMDVLENMIFAEVKPLLIKLYYHKWKEYKLKTIREIAAMLLIKEIDVDKDMEISYYARYLQLYENNPDMIKEITLKIDSLSSLISKSQRGRPNREAKFHYDFNQNNDD
jgi:hypothetical protein